MLASDTWEIEFIWKIWIEIISESVWSRYNWNTEWLHHSGDKGMKFRGECVVQMSHKYDGFTRGWQDLEWARFDQSPVP